MLYNLHTHTKRCNHASGEDREYVEAAIKAGIKVLGFADHCPQFFPNTDYYSFFRMRPELAEDYVQSVRALQKEYESDIKILLGFETEYYPKTFEKFMKFTEPLNLDYLIMGQHFIHNEFDCPSFYGSAPSRGDILQYISQTLEGLETGAFTYIAHPDIISFREEDRDFYKAQIKPYCERLKAMNIPIEYNILGHKNKKWYPNPEFWKIAAQTGNSVVLGFDAHAPEALLESGVYGECVAELKKFGIQPVSFEDITVRKPAKN